MHALFLSTYTEDCEKTFRKAFGKQKYRAKERGIKFLLTFEEWLEIWHSSGQVSSTPTKYPPLRWVTFAVMSPRGVGTVAEAYLRSWRLGSSTAVLQPGVAGLRPTTRAGKK